MIPVPGAPAVCAVGAYFARIGSAVVPETDQRHYGNHAVIGVPRIYAALRGKRCRKTQKPNGETQPVAHESASLRMDYP